MGIKTTLRNRGEGIAKRFLQSQGYCFLASNVRHFRREVDLVFFDPYKDIYRFVEVKYRRNGYWPTPEQWEKQKEGYRLVAEIFLSKLKHKKNISFDLLLIDKERNRLQFIDGGLMN